MSITSHLSVALERGQNANCAHANSCQIRLLSSRLTLEFEIQFSSSPY